MTGKHRSEANRTITVCVDAYEQGEISGRFYRHGQEDEVHPFRNLTQLLLGVEEKLNAANFPQRFTAMRTFAPRQHTLPEKQADGKRGSGLRSTFLVKILFRQHASWQGTVTWPEGCGEQSFRSVSELIMLMDSVLRDSYAG